MRRLTRYLTEWLRDFRQKKAAKSVSFWLVIKYISGETGSGHLGSCFNSLHSSGKTFFFFLGWRSLLSFSHLRMPFHTIAQKMSRFQKPTVFGAFFTLRQFTYLYLTLIKSYITDRKTIFRTIILEPCCAIFLIIHQSSHQFSIRHIVFRFAGKIKTLKNIKYKIPIIKICVLFIKLYCSYKNTLK